MAKPEKQRLWNIICFIGVILGFLLCYVPVAFLGFLIFFEASKIGGVAVWIVGGLFLFLEMITPRDKTSDPPLDN